MFKQISIELTGPICSCEEQKLEWAVSLHGNQAGILIDCKTCNTKYQVGPTKVVAQFKLDVPYPGAAAKTVTKEKEKLSLDEKTETIMKNNVLPFLSRDELDKKKKD